MARLIRPAYTKGGQSQFMAPLHAPILSVEEMQASRRHHSEGSQRLIRDTRACAACGAGERQAASAYARKTAELESGVPSAGVAARVVPERANASPGASCGGRVVVAS